MAVYVDDMARPYGRMIMCRMIADTEDELHAMADTNGVQRRWYQGDHYDISRAKKQLALDAGAIPITWRECGCMCTRRRLTGALGYPADAVHWARMYFINNNRGARPWNSSAA